MASSVDSRDLVEGGISAGIYVGANVLLKNKGRFNTSQAVRQGFQQGALTVAAPIAREAITNAGFSVPLSEDIFDPLLVGAGHGVLETVKGKKLDPSQIFYSVGASFLARKGRDFVTTGSFYPKDKNDQIMI